MKLDESRETSMDGLIVCHECTELVCYACNQVEVVYQLSIKSMLYTKNYQNKFSDLSTTISTITGLEEASTYQIRMYCRNEHGRGPPSLVMEESTAEAAPSGMCTRASVFVCADVCTRGRLYYSCFITNVVILASRATVVSAFDIVFFWVKQLYLGHQIFCTYSFCCTYNISSSKNFQYQ